MYLWGGFSFWGIEERPYERLVSYFAEKEAIFHHAQQNSIIDIQ